MLISPLVYTPLEPIWWDNLDFLADLWYTDYILHYTEGRKMRLANVVLVTEVPPIGLIDLESPRPLLDRAPVKKLVWWVPLDLEAYKQGKLRLRGTDTPIPNRLEGNIHEMYDE